MNTLREKLNRHQRIRQTAAEEERALKAKPAKAGPPATPDIHPPEKLPDPWLFDSEALLRELDRCRELVLNIPATTQAVHFASNVAINAIWNLTQHLRYLLQLHRQGQSAWAKTHQEELQRSLQATPIQGAAGMEKQRQVRELTNRIQNLQEQLLSLVRQSAQDELRLKPPRPVQERQAKARAVSA